MNSWNAGNLEGLVPLAAGIYGYLLAKGTLPRHPKDPVKIARWRQKFGPMLTVVGPLLVVFGILQLLGVL